MKTLRHLTAKYEKQKYREGYEFVIGCDEVGRGCLAGPVVASAVALDLRRRIKDFSGIADSKLLSAKQRERLDGIIKQHSLGWGMGVVEHAMIDEVNIHNASLLAMRRAVESLMSGFRISQSNRDPGMVQEPFDFAQVDNNKMFVVVDGKFTIPGFHMKQEAVVDGDAKILSIAAASIIAKVYRDDLMRDLDRQYPNYKFDQHKGYATFHHRQAIKKFGLTPIHRLSFCS